MNLFTYADDAVDISTPEVLELQRVKFPQHFYNFNSSGYIGDDGAADPRFVEAMKMKRDPQYKHLFPEYYYQSIQPSDTRFIACFIITLIILGIIAFWR